MGSSPQQSVPGPSQESPVHRKSLRGCLVCRSRKVRCDRSLPACRNCSRLGVTCPGYDERCESASREQILKSAQHIFREAGVEKRRVGSCEECRTTKSRCSRTRPSCTRCTSRRLSCVYQGQGNPGQGQHRTGSQRPHIQAGSGQGTATSSSPQLEYDMAGVFDVHDFGLEYCRLFSETLPEEPALRNLLVDTYFSRVQPLKMLSFIHKPTFMHAMDRATIIQDYGEPMLYVICALGARVIFYDKMQSMPVRRGIEQPIPGEAWAERARKEVLSEVHLPTVQHIMTMLLLCEYGSRADQSSLVFVLIGISFRCIRLLGLDTPKSTEAPQTQACDALASEIEKRIVWACYLFDTLAASGVDANSSWFGRYPKLPLPCPEREFLARCPSSPALFLGDFEDAERLGSIVCRLDLSSLLLVLVRLRDQVLRLIRTPPHPDISLWDPSSEFMTIIRKLDIFSQKIPEAFTLTDLNIYLLKDQRILGAVFELHRYLHAVYFDLTRVSLPGFTFPLAAGLRDAPPEFKRRCQDLCRTHAIAMSNLARQGFSHAPVAFDDVFCTAAMFEAAKIQIIYSSTVDNSVQSVEETKRNVRTALKLAQQLQVAQQEANPYIRLIIPLCMVFGLRDIAEEWRQHLQSSPDNTPEVTGSADIDHLSQIATFRRARNQLRQHQLSTSPSTTLSSGHRHSIVTASSRAGVEARSPDIDSAPSLTMQQQPLIYQGADAMHLAVGTALELGLGPSDALEPNIHMLDQASLSEFIMAADDLGEYLTWDITGSSEVPPWSSVGWLEEPPG
ncbi:hypothetical protein EDB81DRAFT_778906 [Dactylonectria macrodidyma]|uniref:Zn(2)-C6 fungal-type domain-containing protein n=1 Tax=Dactylonectria macrodidyma TaxID=307937 RepID=A0A9P9FMH3_9HYPO|nr:hypothetical protein EDB81DRAFT_778906 [Dactylonectria macrodidyma]